MASGTKGKASNFFVWIILVLLIIGLAGFGVTNFGGSVNAVAAVGDTEIEINDYARELQSELRAVEAQSGQSLTLSQATAFGLDRAVMQRLLARAALEEEARRVGLSVGDDVVARELLQIPAFQGLNGEFDREAYAFTLRQSGLNEKEFEENLRADTASALLQAAVVNGVAAPEALTDAILSYVSETRSFELIRVTPADMVTAAVEPTDEDLRAHYAENEAAYTLPERKKITYAWVTPDMLLDTVEVDEEALRALYEERADQYQRPERRLVERLVFADDAAAQAAMDRFNANEATFEELVAERGLALADIDLGDITRDDLGNEAADALFGLIAPGVVGPLPSSLGPALYRMNAILAAQETSFEEAREDLRAEFAADRARRVILDSASGVDDLLAGGATLEEVAAETDLELGSIDYSINSEGGIAAYQAFAEAARAVQQGDFPEVIELDDGGLFALRLDAVEPPALQPFEEVEDLVYTDYKRALENRQLAELAEGLAPRFTGTATAEDLGFTATLEEGLTRDAFLDVSTPDLMTRVFELSLGETAALGGAGEAYVIKLTAITPPDLSDDSVTALRDALNAQSSEAIAQDLLAAFIGAVQNEAGITLNQAAVNAVHAQFP